MIGVKDEDLVHRRLDHRVDLIFLSGDAEGHAQEIAGVAQVVARIEEGLADRIFIGHRRDRRNLGDQAVAGDQPLVRIVDVGRVMIEGRQRADHAAHDRHRVRVAAEAAIEGRELFVQHRVAGDRAGELAQFGLGSAARR
jgi:hypothetical protein